MSPKGRGQGHVRNVIEQILHATASYPRHICICLPAYIGQFRRHATPSARAGHLRPRAFPAGLAPSTRTAPSPSLEAMRHGNSIANLSFGDHGNFILHCPAATLRSTTKCCRTALGKGAPYDTVSCARRFPSVLGFTPHIVAHLRACAGDSPLANWLSTVPTAPAPRLDPPTIMTAMTTTTTTSTATMAVTEIAHAR